SMTGSTSTFSIRTPHGPLASVALKGLRKAIDDRRRLETLERLIGEAKASGKDQAIKQAAADEEFINSFRTPLRKKMKVAGGRSAKLAELKVEGLDGPITVIGPDAPSKWDVCEMIARDVSKRIVSLQAKLAQ
ncbi:MAG: hypothetical protein J7M14_00735, partial [Planctomycetes bacterium]|nr:hypothetical protein [Planctomycetota bacterium]